MRNDDYRKYVLEDLDPEEPARRARARQAYEKMYPLNKDDPYGAKRLERVRTTAGVTRVFNQVAREIGLGGLVDDPDSEQSKERLEPREIDRNAYCRHAERAREPRGQRRRYPKSKNFYVTLALNSLLQEYGLSQFCVEEAEVPPGHTRRFVVRGS